MAGKCCFFSRNLVNEFEGGKNNQYNISAFFNVAIDIV
jgi:hypothetical protein